MFYIELLLRTGWVNCAIYHRQNKPKYQSFTEASDIPTSATAYNYIITTLDQIQRQALGSKCHKHVLIALDVVVTLAFLCYNNLLFMLKI